MSTEQLRSACRLAAIALGLYALLAPGPARARELWTSQDGEYALALDSAFEATWLVSHMPDDPLLFPERNPETGSFRLRFALGSRLGSHADTQVAYEQHARLTSDTTGLSAAGLLPPTGPPPYRVWPIEQAIVDRPNVLHTHQLDRAFVALHFAPLELTLGRQAIGLGRGVLFSAVDVLAPFSPLEVDREWRRGVDAAHAELELSDRFSADVIGAPDDEFRDGALLGRVRGYVDAFDASLLGGKREEDWMIGATGSAAIGDAEAHGEAAWFRTDGRGIEEGWLGTTRWVAKFVVGASYLVDVGRGLTLLGEYHYSGFGLRDVGRDASLLLDPDFQARLQRVDTQLLGRHALAAVISYDLSDEWRASLTGLVSPVDGSGLVSPAFTWVPSDAVTIVASGYVPWGAEPSGGVLGSEYGASGITGLLQARIYD